LNSTGKKLRIIELKSSGWKICSEPGWDISIFHKDPKTGENIQYFLPGVLCRPSQLVLQNNERYNVKIFINFRYLYNLYSKKWYINRDYGEYEIQLKLNPLTRRDTIVSNKIKVLYKNEN
jgi:hypothetical protein